MANTLSIHSGGNSPSLPTVQLAARQFAEAAYQLLNALWTAVWPVKATQQAHELTPYEQAEQLRDMASDFIQSDPAFAQDLFAAANRHELEHCH